MSPRLPRFRFPTARAARLSFALCAAALLPAAAVAQKVAPTVTGTGDGARWTFTLGDATFLAGPKHGGRIHALRFGDSDILHMDTSGATNYGSTFWPSPQAVWNWPPPANLDGNGAWTAELSADNVLNMAGMVDNTTMLRFRKEFWADASDSTYKMRFTMVNTGPSRAWAPWQDSRVDTGGVYFFPAGDGPVTGDLAEFVQDSIGMKWYAHGEATTLSNGTTKFYADGSEGWFAHVTADRILLLKKFADSPLANKAPDPENEIEVYSTNRPLNNSDFVEMEVQGSYDTIATDDSTSWLMTWYVRKVPDSIDVSLGSAEVVAFVEDVLEGPTTSLRAAPARATAARLVPTSRGVAVTLPSGRAVTLDLVDARGALVQRVHTGYLAAGRHDFALKAAPKGVYGLVLRGPGAKVLQTRLLPRF